MSGSSARTHALEAHAASLPSPCRTRARRVGAFDVRDLDKVPRDQRTAERGRSGYRPRRWRRPAARAGRNRARTRPHVDHVRAHGADRQRALARVVELAALAEVDRHRHDLRAVLLGQPGNRHRRVQPTRIRQDTIFFIACRVLSPSDHAASFASSAAGASRSGRPAESCRHRRWSRRTSASWARSIHSARPCACPRSVRTTRSGSTRSIPRIRDATARRSWCPPRPRPLEARADIRPVPGALNQP